MRDFIKTVFATLVGLTLFGVVGVAGLMAVIIAIASTSAQDVTPVVEKDSILTVDLSQPFQDTPPAANPGEVLGAALSGGVMEQRPLALRSIVMAIEEAKTDDRIKAIYLHGSLSARGAGFAALREYRQALQAFRDAGKPIIAFNEQDWSERDYYLTSVANTVALNPSGYLEMNGLRSETMFFGNALQKYGVGVQVLRVGKYKSFVEQFTRSQSSPEDKEQNQKLLADLWSEFLATTAQSRKLTPQKLQAIADQQVVLMPDQAKAAGLADKVAYPDQMLAELQKLTGEQDKPTVRGVSLAEYAEVIAADQATNGDRVAVVYAEGEIVSGEGTSSSIGGDRLSALLRELRQDNEIKAVVLRVNSPGGGAMASDKIAREVLLLNQKKPVIASMGNYAASGGYQISTYARKIFALPNTVTGSIGTFGLLPNVQQLANNNGVTWDGVKTAPFADIETISRPKTAAELAIAQRVADRVYEQFIGSVATSRSMSKAQVNEVAQGRVWSGVEAKKIGLVDELGGLEAAIAAAAKAAKLGDNFAIEEYPQPRRFGDRLAEIFSSFLPQVSVAQDPLSVQVQQVQADLQSLRSLNDPQGIYNRMPLGLRID